MRYLLATSLQAIGRPQPEVVAQYQRALQLRPDYINALTQLAIIALANQRVDESRQLIEKSIRVEAGNPSLHINLGAYWVRLGRPDDAVKHFEAALRLNPKASGAHNELGQIRLNQNRVEEGRAHFAARARLEPWNADALADYGTLLTNMRRLDEARPLLERALWIRPDFPRARQALDITLQLQRQKG